MIELMRIKIISKIRIPVKKQFIPKPGEPIKQNRRTRRKYKRKSKK